jgi:mRNA interferase RelE/StbE
MKWRVVFARTAEKELAKLSTDVRLRVARAIRGLEDNPVPSGAKRLKGRAEFRLRVGDCRVLYFLDHSISILTIVAVGHRREVYR